MRVAIAYPSRDVLEANRARFERMYRADPDTECWEWIRGRTTAGYGHISIGNRYFQAHRIAFLMNGGTVPNGLFLDHLCRNRGCVNPAHLEVVTHAENIRRGIRTRLDPDMVRLIRARMATGISQRALAREMGIDHSTISRVLAGLRWSDIDAKSEEAVA